MKVQMKILSDVPMKEKNKRRVEYGKTQSGIRFGAGKADCRGSVCDD